MEMRVSNHDQPENDINEEKVEEQVAAEQVAIEEEPQSEAAAGVVAELEAEIEKLQSELNEAKEQAMRAAAEAQNVRRRAEQDVEKAHKFGVEKFVSDMLPVADNLVRAVEASAAEAADLASVTEGVELTLKSLMDALQRHKVEQVNPEGEPFNPELHQAMTAVPQPDVEPNTVINVYQCGYTLNGRLVRPAMVVVSKAPE
ncbi:nucleotide exchange factor GrpE [Teredinibacter franksiae]|uniref:nucleotide exchange factor GrpE n=1 Tax=Teredinibacter franksiae TaxID=2761453 RepID=UPI0035E43230